MKKVLPVDTQQTITVVPRFYPTTDLTISLTEEGTDTTETATNTYTIADGFLNLQVTYDFTDKEKLSIKVEEGTDIVYRGKIIVTDQETQEYKLTDGLYYYE